MLSRAELEKKIAGLGPKYRTVSRVLFDNSANPMTYEQIAYVSGQSVEVARRAKVRMSQLGIEFNIVRGGKNFRYHLANVATESMTYKKRVKQTMFTPTANDKLLNKVFA